MTYSISDYYSTVIDNTITVYYQCDVCMKEWSEERKCDIPNLLNDCINLFGNIKTRCCNCDCSKKKQLQRPLI